MDEYLLCDILCALEYVKIAIIIYIIIRGWIWIRQKY